MLVKTVYFRKLFQIYVVFLLSTTFREIDVLPLRIHFAREGKERKSYERHSDANDSPMHCKWLCCGCSRCVGDAIKLRSSNTTVENYCNVYFL